MDRTEQELSADCIMVEDQGSLLSLHPPQVPASDPNYIKHVICEGARFHVISYSSHGRKCSEPNCIINKPTEATVSYEKETKQAEGSAPRQLTKPLREWSERALRIKVAELCRVIPAGIHEAYVDMKRVPNYPADLNAMHEGIVALKVDMYLKFCRLITEKLGAFDAIAATARQQAEIFVEIHENP